MKSTLFPCILGLVLISASINAEVPTGLIIERAGRAQGRKLLNATHGNDRCVIFENNCRSVKWNVAIAYQVEFRQWRSRGWFVLLPSTKNLICWEEASTVWVHIDKADRKGCAFDNSDVIPSNPLRSSQFCVDGRGEFDIQARTVLSGTRNIWAEFFDTGAGVASTTCAGLGSECHRALNFYEIPDVRKFTIMTCS